MNRDYTCGAEDERMMSDSQGVRKHSRFSNLWATCSLHLLAAA